MSAAVLPTRPHWAPPGTMFLRAKVVAAWHVDRRTREVRREMLRTMLRLTLASVEVAIVATDRKSRV